MAELPTAPAAQPYSLFCGSRRIDTGPWQTIAPLAKRALLRGADLPVLIFEDGSGELVDIDPTADDSQLIAQRPPVTSPPHPVPADPAASRRRGRPRLGVVAKEVTLLPRHWEWLASQPGGISVALRRLVDDARQTRAERERRRQAQGAAYRFMSALAGDFGSYEEALRALFADDRERFGQLVAAWPADVGRYALELAFPAPD